MLEEELHYRFPNMIITTIADEKRFTSRVTVSGLKQLDALCERIKRNDAFLRRLDLIHAFVMVTISEDELGSKRIFDALRTNTSVRMIRIKLAQPDEWV